MRWFDCGTGGVLVVPGVGELEIHLTAGGDSVAWWVALQNHDCLWHVPTVSDLPGSESQQRPNEMADKGLARGTPVESTPRTPAKLALPTDSVRSPNAPASLGQVHRGEVSVEYYLQARVKDATQHLENAVSAEQMDVIKGLLWASLQRAPIVAELVRRAASRPRSR